MTAPGQTTGAPLWAELPVSFWGRLQTLQIIIKATITEACVMEDAGFEIRWKSERYYRNPRHYYGDEDELNLDGLSLGSHSGELDD